MEDRVVTARENLKILRLRIANSRKEATRAFWETQDELIADLDDVTELHQLVSALKIETERRLKLLENTPVEADTRSPRALVPLRVKFIDNYIRDLVTLNQFPILLVMVQWHDKQEVEKIAVGNRIMNMMNTVWREEIYKERNWMVEKEETCYSLLNLVKAMDECNLNHHQLVPWFVNTYDIKIEGFWPAKLKPFENEQTN